MDLKESLLQSDGASVSGVYVLLVGKSTSETVGGKSYLNLTVSDKTTTHSFKNFFKTESEYENQNSNLEEGKIYQMFYSIGSYNGQKQVQNARFRPIKDEDYEDAKKFIIATYELKDKDIEDFKAFIDEVTVEEKYNTFVKEALGNFREKIWTDFITAPAAKSHHGNKIHGLFYHTYAVAKNCKCIFDRYAAGDAMPYKLETVNLSRLMTGALLHDIMKVEEYLWNDGIKSRNDIFLRHIERGTIYLDRINNKLNNILSDEELDYLQYFILSHHGDFGNHKPLNIENWILHLADMIDAKLVYEIENN